MSIKARFARRWNQKGSKTLPKSLHKAAITPKIGFPPLLYGYASEFRTRNYLTRSRAGRMGLVAMVIAVFGHALFLTIGGVSTFATPVEGQAYLAGIEEYHKLPTTLAGTAQTATLGVSILLGFVGNVLLGVAVWRSGILPKWAGALWAFAPVLMYIF